MGVLADLLANAKSFDGSDPAEGSSRVAKRRLETFINELGDRDYPAGAGSAVDEVQVVEQLTEDTTLGGTYTLTFVLHDGTTFTTGNIAFGANAATITTAINAAADPKVQGFVAGDIAVTGGGLDAADVTITFSGASVRQRNHGLVTIDDTLITGGSANSVTVTTDGHPVRTGLSALVAIGILGPSLPANGATTGFDVQNARGSFPHGFDEQTVKLIVDQAQIEEGTSGLKEALLTALGY